MTRSRIPVLPSNTIFLEDLSSQGRPSEEEGDRNQNIRRQSEAEEKQDPVENGLPETQVHYHQNEEDDSPAPYLRPSEVEEAEHMEAEDVNRPNRTELANHHYAGEQNEDRPPPLITYQDSPHRSVDDAQIIDHLDDFKFDSELQDKGPVDFSMSSDHKGAMNSTPSSKARLNVELQTMILNIKKHLLPEIRENLEAYGQNYLDNLEADTRLDILETVQRAHRTDSSIVKAVSEEYLCMDDEVLALAALDEVEIKKRTAEARNHSKTLMEEVMAKRKQIEQLQIVNFQLKKSLIKYLQ